jgi:hypothetical protein
MKNTIKKAALLVSVLAGTVGFAAAQDYRYYDRDDYRYGDNRYENRYYDRDDYHDNFRRGMHVARQLGFRDGAQVAREDMWRGKRFNPNPRGRYDDADHGYNRAFGDRHEYREHYTRAYREGYMSTYRGYGSYYR